MMNSCVTLFSIAARWAQPGRAAALRGASVNRVEVCPPAARRRRLTWKLRLGDWLRAGWEPTYPDAQRRDDGADQSTAILLAVRREFIESLSDIRTPRACVLLEHIRAARSLRELWHLRPEIFDLVARAHAQSEADRRLTRLNRHFPTRSPRSGFGLLGGSEVDR